MFLTSKDPVEDRPQAEWMLSTENKPDSKTGRSGAPATIICVEKDGWRDIGCVLFSHRGLRNFISIKTSVSL